MARRALDLGFHISLAGIVTFPRALELQEVARMVPLDRLLIETDSPFLAPVPHRGKRNEPAHVVRVAETIAALRGVTRRGDRRRRRRRTSCASSTRKCNSSHGLGCLDALTLRARICSSERRLETRCVRMWSDQC